VERTLSVGALGLLTHSVKLHGFLKDSHITCRSYVLYRNQKKQRSEKFLANCSSIVSRL